MNRTILILIALSAAVMLLPLPSPGAVNEYMADNGYDVKKVASSTPLPVNVASGTMTLTGTMNTTATPTAVLPFTQYRFNVASNTLVTFASVASWSAGDIVTIRAINGRIYVAGNSSVATSVAILGDYVDSGEIISFTPASSTLGTWGSAYMITTSAASAAIRVWPRGSY